jgi:hypothetical protein
MGSKGTRTLVKVCQLVAVSERHSRTASAFVLARPVVVATAIGKNAEGMDFSILVDRNVDLQQQTCFIERVELVVKIGVRTRRLGLPRIMSLFHRHLPFSSPARQFSSRSPLQVSSISVAAGGAADCRGAR